MSQRLYDASTAEALMKFAYPEYGEHDLKPYEIREDGVYAADTFRHLCPPGTIYDWTPADEMEWPGSPNPDTAPFLPIPFNAAQLAAAVIPCIAIRWCLEQPMQATQHSADKRELLDAGFIFETVKGQRPNKAARYAVTWRALDRHPGYDVGSMEGFQRGAYRHGVPAQDAAKITPLVPPHGTEKNASLVPSHGPIERPIAPPHGTEKAAPVPPHGTIRGVFGALSVPPHGHHLENHLPASAAKDVQDVEGVQETRANIGQDGDSASHTQAAPRPTSPRRRPKPLVRKEAVRSTVRAESAAQMELLLPIGCIIG